MVEFNPLTDDEFAGTWLGNDSILYQSLEGSEQRLLVGSVADGQASTRDLGASSNDWIPFVVSPDTHSAIVSLPGATGSERNIVSVDLATGISTPTALGADDISWQRRSTLNRNLATRIGPRSETIGARSWAAETYRPDGPDAVLRRRSRSASCWAR